jgi:hypothetical protein
MIATQTLKLLRETPEEKLAEAYCTLNKWGWPGWLPGNEDPKDYANGSRTEIMRWIVGAVGKKRCSRAWNADMTDDEHEAWWRQHGGRY